MKKLNYSKMLPIITGGIFIWCLIMAFTSKIENGVDASIYISAITASSAIFGSSIIWYLKRRVRETAYDLRIKLYVESTRQRLWFNREMIKLMKKYNLTENDLSYIDQSGDIDEMMQTAIDSTVMAVDEAQAEGDQADEIQSFT